ncbi:hypothetical protein Q3G72_016228 [Acer saccharum]|nr:hypothetical protein Q3G72_016228 [Acer saccharum]
MAKKSGVPLTNVNRSYTVAVKTDNKRIPEVKIVMSWLGYREDEEWLSRCAVGTMKDFMSVQSINKKLEDRGFVFSSSYMGRGLCSFLRDLRGIEAVEANARMWEFQTRNFYGYGFYSSRQLLAPLAHLAMVSQGLLGHWMF